MKKGVSLALNTIIIAVIAILVLVVLIVIFSSSARDYVFSTKSCTGTYGGVCKAECEDLEAAYRSTDCKKDDAMPVCCVAIQK